MRECNGCTKCCEGWLEENINGHQMCPGKPCFFLGKTCTIYADRPTSPCKDYYCSWLEEDIFPMWLKPNTANIIITKKIHENPNLTYYEIIEAGEKIAVEALNWLILWSLKRKINIIYHVSGKPYVLGSAEFNKSLPQSLVNQHQ